MGRLVFDSDPLTLCPSSKLVCDRDPLTLCPSSKLARRFTEHHFIGDEAEPHDGQEVSKSLGINADYSWPAYCEHHLIMDGVETDEGSEENLEICGYSEEDVEGSVDSVYAIPVH